MRRCVVAGLIALALFWASPARADTQEESFAHFFSIAPAAVRDVAGYKTPSGVAVTHILFGHYTAEQQTWPGLVLMRCNDKECRGSRVHLHPANADIQLLGIVDLRAPGPLGDRTSLDKPYHGQWVDMDRWLKAPPRYAWPALLVKIEQRTHETSGSRFGGDVEGDHREARLLLVSLRAADEKDPQLFEQSIMDLYPTGAGTTTSYRLAPCEDKPGDKADKPFDIVATEQRHIENRSMCLNPPPVEYRLIYNEHRYQRREKNGWQTTGCH